MANNTIVPHSLDDYFQSTPIGSIDKAIGNNLYGINHRQIPNAVPSNKDTYGYTFFVRPQLNLQTDNIRNERRFYPLLTENVNTIQRCIRSLLDPRLLEGYRFGNYTVPPISAPLIDNSQAFISILTNNLNSISGWPDIAAPTFTSKPGLYNEAWSIVDGIVRNYESYDIEANFRNTRGDPILYMFYIWLHYAANVFEGRLVPYMDFISENEIDYDSRIYRLVTDQNKEVVRKIAACGACFPINTPTGSFFDFNNDKPYNDQNRDISIRFKCMGFECQDDILIAEFNQTVQTFNPSMIDGQRSKDMVKVSKNTADMFNNRGYPRINPDTNELEWWVYADNYQARTKAFIRENLGDAEKINNTEFGD